MALRYQINPKTLLNTWRMQDLGDALEALALNNYYQEQAYERR